MLFGIKKKIQLANVKNPFLILIFFGLISLFSLAFILKGPIWALLLLLFLIFIWLVFFNLRIGLLVILLALLLGQLTRFTLPFGGAVVLNDLLIPVIFLVWVLVKLAKKESFAFKTPLGLPLAIFILLAILSLLLNSISFLYSELFQAVAYLVRFISYAFVFYLVLDVVKDEKTWRKFYSLTIWVGLLFALLGFLQLVFIPSFEFMTKYGWDPHLNRLLSTFFDPNYAGGFLVFVNSLVLGRMLFTQNKAEKGLLFFGFLFLLFALVLTYSRSAYLAFAVSFLVLGILKSWRLLLFGFVLLAIVFFSIPRMQERILGAFSLDITAKMRLESFEDASKIIADYPYFGTGYNTLRFVREDYGQIEDTAQHTAGGFDSSFLTILATTGIFGFLVYLWLWFRILKESFLSFWNKKAPPEFRGLSLGIFSGFIGLIFHSQFVNSLLYPHIMIYLWFVLGLLFTGEKIKMGERK